MSHELKTSCASPRISLRAAAGGCLLAAGAVAGVTLSPSILGGLVGPGGAQNAAHAGETNYVRSFTHEAYQGILLDEEIAFQFNAAVLPSSVVPDTIFVRKGQPSATEQAQGRYVIGKFLYDNTTQRRVVVRPEAIQEYFQIIGGLSRTDASAQADNMLRKIQSSGSFKALAKVDKGLRSRAGLGNSSGAGTRLDDPGVNGVFPAPQRSDADNGIRTYREKVAGDDALWQDYVVNQNFAAFTTLESNSEYERFFHPRDPGTGAKSQNSVLRKRKYRQVLIDRRQQSRVMFVPQVPIRADLTDSGYSAQSAYTVTLPTAAPGVLNTVLTLKGQRPLLAKDGHDYATYFTTIPNTGGAGLFAASEATVGVGTWQPPRVVNQTPPIGETFIDPTTDWEDPDNVSVVTTVAARKAFSVRLRFAQPLDPRSISNVTCTLTKTKDLPGTAGERIVSVPVPVGVFLNQDRLGIVEIEITPATALQGNSQYEVRISNLVKSLHGETLGSDYRGAFITGAATPPLDKIKDDFDAPDNRADPVGNPDTFGLVSTALWPAPSYLFTNGGLAANFMPFAGTGLGANQLPGDTGTPIVTDLVVSPGNTIRFRTENLEIGNPDFGKAVEYNYRSIDMNTGTVQTLGRHPLVLRSQAGVVLTNTNFALAGGAGGNGLTNTDTVNGEPAGGLGGAAGPGGFAGGAGACSSLVDSLGLPIVDAFGKRQFDSTKFNATDGLPSFLSTGPNTGGAGAGGFSGDQDFPLYDANMSGTADQNDYPVMKERHRESGGGGGHATVGGNGAGSGGTQKTTSGGYSGGRGGSVYGTSTLSDQPLNALGAPVLAFGAGGAGGGGGGAEDDGTAAAGDATPGPEDSGGGGGGGGGGAVQIVARGSISLSGTVIDVRGGAGGRTFNAANSATGQGAAGGCGSGGTIWMSCYEGQISISNGSQLRATGGDNANSIGQIRSNLLGSGSDEGTGGRGGDGFVRLEDADGSVVADGSSTVQGVSSVATYRPTIVGAFPGRAVNDQMVVNDSIAYSVWFDSGLDTPTYEVLFDDVDTVEVDGTNTTPGAGTIVIECRSAPGDPARVGRPNLGQATSWVAYAQISTVAISDRRFIQFRVRFSLPLTYSFDDARPYVRCLAIDIQTK